MIRIINNQVLIVHNIIKAIDNGPLTVMLFLDLSSAFDTVDHIILSINIHRLFSVDGIAFNWFHSYLTDRSQTFSVGDSKSDSHSVGCSVPQGSVLGPVQFVAYTEDVDCHWKLQNGMSSKNRVLLNISLHTVTYVVETVKLTVIKHSFLSSMV